ncbi:terminase large subunit domain-containing protein [Oerskovia enterophila]
MSLLESGAWRALPPAEKEHLRNRLAEKHARNGNPIGGPETPGALAVRHEPNIQVQRPHLELIDKALTWVKDTPNAKLMIWTPPQIGKSVRVSRWLPFWWLTHRPQDRILMASYAASLAETHGAACRDLISAYGARYGLQLKSDENTRSDWSLTAGGGLRSRGTKGGITGQSMNLGIIDDPYADRASADSSTIRKAVWEWYSSAFISRRSPGARQIVVHTRWHQQDLSGMLLEREGRVEDNGEWKVVHLPAIATAPDPERGFREDSLGRKPGEPLTHPLIDPDDTAALNDHWVRQKASVTTRDWAAMFMGSPVTAEGALLSAENLKNATTKDVPAPRRTVVGVDPSGGGRDTAGIIGGHLGTDGRMYWTHDRTAQMSSDQWSRAACQLAYDIDADCVVFEANYGGDMAGTLIRQAWDAMQNEGAIDRRALCPRIKKVTARKSKFLRAEPIAQAVLTQRAWFSADHSLAGLKSEWELWEPDSTWSPGALDAAVYVAYELLPPINAGSSVSSAAKRSRSSVTGTSSLAARRTR